MRNDSGKNLALVLSVLVASTLPGRAGEYTFQIIADNTGYFSGFAGSPFVNDLGTAAFEAHRPNVPGTGVYTSDGVDVITIADSTGPFTGVSAGTIASDGTVAFWARDENIYYICKGDGQSTTTIADNSGALGWLSMGPTMGPNGWVAFGAQSEDYPNGGILRGNGTILETVVDTNGPFMDFFGPVRFVDEDTLAFWAIRAGSGEGIFTSDGETTTIIADSAGEFCDFASDPDANSDGIVAFVAQLDCGGSRGIYIGDGSFIDMIVDDSGLFEYPQHPSINDNGDIAFQSSFDSSEQIGIFTGPDFEEDKVITTGDPLFGSEVQWLAKGNMNNAGDIAFYAFLEDGRTALTVATLIPEPTTIWLILLAIAPTLRRWVRPDPMHAPRPRPIASPGILGARRPR